MTDTDRGRRRRTRPLTTDRRTDARGRFHMVWDLIFGGLRSLGVRANSFYATVGVFLVIGVVIAIAGTLAFAEVGEWVQKGITQSFDVAVLEWMHQHHSPLLTQVATELTYLGTGTVVMMIVAVAALFLWHTQHKHSARLLLAAVAGNIILNGVLKLAFHRARPTVFEWQTTAVSSSFPSGHAMSATVCYGTVAYLVIRLEKHRWSRVLTGIAAVVLILLICTTRLYLGVHYPSDVIAGMLVGLAWAGFCMATLEASLVIARRRAPRDVVEERRAPTEGVTTSA
jgi:membrane-associated phospholipid phosphatase